MKRLSLLSLLLSACGADEADTASIPAADGCLYSFVADVREGPDAGLSLGGLLLRFNTPLKSRSATVPAQAAAQRLAEASRLDRAPHGPGAPQRVQLAAALVLALQGEDQVQLRPGQAELARRGAPPRSAPGR